MQILGIPYTSPLFPPAFPPSLTRSSCWCVLNDQVPPPLHIPNVLHLQNSTILNCVRFQSFKKMLDGSVCMRVCKIHQETTSQLFCSCLTQSRVQHQSMSGHNKGRIELHVRTHKSHVVCSCKAGHRSCPHQGTQRAMQPSMSGHVKAVFLSTRALLPLHMLITYISRPKTLFNTP